MGNPNTMGNPIAMEGQEKEETRAMETSKLKPFLKELWTKQEYSIPRITLSLFMEVLKVL